MKLLAKIRDAMHRTYEEGLYKANPCDAGSVWFATSVGQGLSRLAVACQCCNGARVLAAAVLGVALPAPYSFAFLGALVGLVVVHAALYALAAKEALEWPESAIDYAEAAKEEAARATRILADDQSFEGVVKLLQRGLDESAFAEQYARTEELRRKAAITNMEIEAALAVLASADQTRAVAREALLSRPMDLQ